MSHSSIWHCLLRATLTVLVCFNAPARTIAGTMVSSVRWYLWASGFQQLRAISFFLFKLIYLIYLAAPGLSHGMWDLVP